MLLLLAVVVVSDLFHPTEKPAAAQSFVLIRYKGYDTIAIDECICLFYFLRPSHAQCESEFLAGQERGGGSTSRQHVHDKRGVDLYPLFVSSLLWYPVSSQPVLYCTDWYTGSTVQYRTVHRMYR